MADPDFVERAGRRLACRHRPGAKPTIVFLPGYGSDMDGTKALALDAWAAQRGLGLLRLDYAGCGASEGAFEEGTLESWRDDALAVIAAKAEGPLLLVGSSMGGWLMLLAALALGERVTGLVGVAAAPDFTEWGFAPARRKALRRAGVLREASPYSDEPTVTTLAFWESGQRCRVLEKEIAIDCPVRLLHGQEDADVPSAVSTHLSRALRSADVQTVLVKGGDHRLSRAGDIALLIATVESLLERP